MSKYAIIKSGSKQYKVAPGDVIDVELVKADQSGKIAFNEVIFFHDGSKSKVGAPCLSNAAVHAEVLDQVRGPKVFAFKYKRRKRSTRRKVGHRQHYARVKITELAI